jgi:putative transposase
VSRTVSPSVNRVYGLARVCTVWHVPRATLYRRRRSEAGGSRHRPGPAGPMRDAELVDAIRELLAESGFHGEGYRKIWARLRFKGIRTSKRRVLRLTREHGLQAPHRLGRPRGPRAHDGTIRTERVDEMWGTDLTATLTGEGQAAVFILVDHCSGECLGIHAARRATRFEALESLRQAVRHSFGAFGKGLGQGTKLRHDHGMPVTRDGTRHGFQARQVGRAPLAQARRRQPPRPAHRGAAKALSAPDRWAVWPWRATWPWLAQTPPDRQKMA